MTTWAEVVEPSTRALVDEDSDEDYLDSKVSEPVTRLELSWVEGNNSEIDLFIVVHGLLPTSFVTKFIVKEHHELIAEVQEYYLKESSEREPLLAPRVKTSSPIYSINKNTCICLCKDIDINNANKFRNAILPLLQKSSVIVVVSAQKSCTYLYDKLGVDLVVPFARCLHSNAYTSEPIDVPLLEQPNIVTGLPAAVLSWCEVFSVPGILYCCYSDTTELNSISADPLIKIFSNLSTEILDPSKVKFRKETYNPVSTNLYM